VISWSLLPRYDKYLRDIFADLTSFQYSASYKRGDKSIKIQANYVGNNVKSMYVSVEASLKKLRTSYIDILYVHWFDYETSVEEIMNGLHNLVTQGKVLYLVS
jgi:aryl-alcohol dehydrogenase-like predicted oxidoreductase